MSECFVRPTAARLPPRLEQQPQQQQQQQQRLVQQRGGRSQQRQQRARRDPTAQAQRARPSSRAALAALEHALWGKEHVRINTMHVTRLYCVQTGPTNAQ
ncbi:unnamed protein product [Plutella xylostella]|uniref:(diamondback moth) hypothetical protein n=1 Tax=Plutella xylostella TaxID=51655 RepID=A0A8S4FJV2_PLUXY|nr:unnamed protein product [Plutella xylostella]